MKECLEQKQRPDPKFMIDLHFHDLRHEAASRLFEVGLNVMEVASITGHKTLQTLKRYTHLRAEELALKLR
jgi:integrase